MREYLFDVKLMASIRVRATSADEARKMILAELDCADTNFGAWPNGDPILGEASVAGINADDVEYLQLVEDEAVDDDGPSGLDWSGPEEGDGDDSVWITDDLGEELVQVDQGDNVEENKEIAHLVCAQINAMHLPFAQVTEELIENQIKLATVEVWTNG